MYYIYRSLMEVMDQDSVVTQAEEVKRLYDQIVKEKGELFKETIAPLQQAGFAAVRRQFYIKLAASLFFVAVFAGTVYYIVSQKDYDPRLYITLGIFAFIAVAGLREALEAKRLTVNQVVRGIVTDKLLKYHNEIPLHYVILSEKKQIRVTEELYNLLSPGDIAEITFIKPNDPTFPVSAIKLGSILEHASARNNQGNEKRSGKTNHSTLGYYFGRFALALLLVNITFFIIHAGRTIIFQQYFKGFSVFYGVVAVLSITPISYFIIYPLLRARAVKKSNLIWGMIFFCSGAIITSAPLLTAADHLFSKVKMIESPETFGPDDQGYFMFGEYYLHKKLQYDSVYYRYDRGAKGSSPMDELNYFVIVPLSKTRSDTVFSMFLYRNVSVSKRTGTRADIQEGLHKLYVKEHKNTMAFDFDAITYFDRSEGGTQTKSTLGQLLRHNVSQMPFRSSKDAVLLVPHSDNIRDEGPGLLLFYAILFGVFMLFSIGFS